MIARLFVALLFARSAFLPAGASLPPACSQTGSTTICATFRDINFGISGCCECSTLNHIWEFPFGIFPFWDIFLLEFFPFSELLLVAVESLEVLNVVLVDDASELFAACGATQIVLVDIALKANDLAARGALDLKDLLELVLKIL